MSESLYEFLTSECIKSPQDKKIVFGREISGAELKRDVEALAGFLQSKGIGKGDVVAICLPNIPQAITALYATNAIGAIAYVLHPKTGEDCLYEEINKTGAKGLFLLDSLTRRHKRAIQSVSVTVVCRTSDYLPRKMQALKLIEPIILPKKAFLYKQTLLNKGFVKTNISADDTAVYLNSGGTTGEPKIVALSNRAFNELALNVRSTVKKCPKYIEKMGMLMTLPLFHGFGLGVCVQVGLLLGYVVPVPVFRAGRVIRMLKATPVHIIVGVPGMLRRLAAKKSFRGEFVNNTRMIFAGGDKVSDGVKQKFEARLAESGSDVAIMEGYGLSEVASVATINVASPHDGSVGQAIDGTDIIIVSEDGSEAKEGDKGEIAVCSPSIMNGYFDGSQPQFFIKNEKKYLLTGDIGYQKGKSIYFCERKKRMIKIGGVNVFPSQVEQVAEQFEGVKQACAVRSTWQGKPAIKLLIVTDKAIGEDYKKSLVAFVGQRLIKYAEPRIVERVAEISVTPLGKADYRRYEAEEASSTVK